LAAHYFETGLERAPNATDVRLELIKLEIREQHWAAARAEIDTLLATEEPDNPGDFELVHRPEAQGLLRRDALPAPVGD
jgi:Tfp pilus assembly protein PilF